MNKFDDIRPFYDAEIPAAMQRIADSPYFPLLASYVYPRQDVEHVRNILREFRTIRDFQLEVMRCVNEQVIDRSITQFSYSGIEHLDPQRRYLFVSNHRDIMLDACLLQYILYQNGHETSEITFGANLMSSPLVIDIGKSNKMFRVERGGSPREFYKSSLHLSEYIRHCITEKNQSVWIAQRNGRTKDGIDRTDQGIIKMFCMSHPDDNVRAILDLHIIPIAISYEWESCDILKAVELYKSRTEVYVKKTGEDLNSILTGIIQPKGRVNIAILPEFTEAELAPLAGVGSNEFNRSFAQMMDKRICKAYQLTPNNFIAHDLLSGTTTYIDRYTSEQRATFLAYMEKLKEYDVPEPDVLRNIFLGIYANPVDSKNEE